MTRASDSQSFQQDTETCSSYESSFAARGTSVG